jgi:glycosyltransferase involved in cell wall biosynthesis
VIQPSEKQMPVYRPRLLHMTTVPTTLSFLESQIQYAKSHGIEVHVISSPDNALVEFGARLGVETHELPMERRITPVRDLLSLWRLGKTLRQLRPQIVHGHTPKGGLLAMLGAWWCGVPVRVYHIHGLPMVTATGLKRTLLCWSEKVSCLLASQVYCVSKSVREVAVKEGLCRAEAIKVLLNGTINGIDAETSFNPDRFEANVRYEVRKAYNIPAEALVVGFAGRIVRDKGIIELAQAWKVLSKEFSNAHLLIIGPFEPQDPVPLEIEEQLRIDERVHLTGWIEPEQIPKHLLAMDILALPTYREGFGNVLLEASAMRLPIVVSRVPGCIDAVIDGNTGTLIPSHDATALADALRIYLGNADLRQRHGLAGRARVLRDFRPEDLSQAIYQEYVRLLEDKGISVTQEQGSELAGNKDDNPVVQVVELS